MANNDNPKAAIAITPRPPKNNQPYIPAVVISNAAVGISLYINPAVIITVKPLAIPFSVIFSDNVTNQYVPNPKASKPAANPAGLNMKKAIIPILDTVMPDTNAATNEIATALQRL